MNANIKQELSNRHQFILRVITIILLIEIIGLIIFNLFILLFQESNFREWFYDIAPITATLIIFFILPTLIVYSNLVSYFFAIDLNKKADFLNSFTKGLLWTIIASLIVGFLAFSGCSAARGCWGGAFSLIPPTLTFFGGVIFSVILSAISYFKT